MSEPTTEAGRRLVKWSREGQVPWDVTLEAVLAIEAEARTLDPDQLRAAWLEHRRKAPGGNCSPDDCAADIAAKYGQAPASQPLTLDVERLATVIRAVEDACPVCGGAGWTVDADPLPSGEPGEPYQVPCWDAEHAVILNAGLSQPPTETDPTFP